VEAKDRVIRLLRKNNRFFTPEDVWWVIETYNLEVGEKEVFAHEVVAEGLECTTNALHAFFESVGDALPLKEVLETEERLRKGEEVRAWCFPEWKGPLRRTFVSVEAGGGKDKLRFSFSSSRAFEQFQLKAFTGVVNIDASNPSMDLKAGSWGWKGEAFFITHKEEALEEALKTVTSLRPVLPAMGLSDLEEGLTALRGVASGERRVEGGYTLIRDGEVWFLKRGSLTGDPDLDRALLREEPITLTFPGDVEIAFKAKFSFEPGHLQHKMSLVQGYLRFGEEVVRFGPEDKFFSFLAGASPLESALRWGLLRKFDLWEQTGDGSFFEGLSPKTIAALRALAELKDPFWFLAEGKFHICATTQLFADF